MVKMIRNDVELYMGVNEKYCTGKGGLLLYRPIP